MSEILIALSRPLQPQLPLSHPCCQRCGRTSSLRRLITKPSNRNGNAGRPYYICTRCNGKSKRGWVSWDDEHGIRDGNPVCYCGALSRQDREAKNRERNGLGFWTCATGSCDYYSKYWNGWTTREAKSTPHVPQCVEFYPWLL